MDKRELIEEVLDILRNMENAIEVICDLDVDAVLSKMDEMRDDNET